MTFDIKILLFIKNYSARLQNLNAIIFSISGMIISNRYLSDENNIKRRVKFSCPCNDSWSSISLEHLIFSEIS